METKYRLREGCSLIKRCFVGVVESGACRTFVSIWLCFSVYISGAQDRPLGVNLTDVSPFGTLWYYTNALKQSSGWLVYDANDEGDAINLSSELTAELRSQYFDVNGYPLQVPFEVDDHPELAGKSLITSSLVLNGQPEPYLYPAGTYQLSFEGTGVIAIQGDVDGAYMEFDLADVYPVPISRPSSVGLQIFILSSDIDDPIRNVSLVFPGYHEQAEIPKYQDDFLRLSEQFEVLRYMKPLKSENNTIIEFEDRSTSENFSYFLDVENDILPGMPYEDVVEISNITQTDPWITIPYLASDDYVRATAELFNLLERDRKVHVEYSNETWNPAYPETRAYMLESGRELVTSEIAEVAEFEAIHRFHALRSLEIWKIFEETLIETAQLVKVHGSQSDPFTADLVWDAYQSDRVNPEGTQPDMVAIAAYIGVTLFDDLRSQNIDICAHTPQQLLDTLVNRINPELNEMVSRYQELFGSSAIEVVAYEGGQHVTELNFQSMEPCAESLVAEMNELPGMTSFFCDLLEQWHDSYDGGLFNVFNLAEKADAFGSFGLLQSQWQVTATAPKWEGVMNCESTPILAVHDAYVINTYPNPSSSILNIEMPVEGVYQLISMTGTVVLSGELAAGKHQLTLGQLSAGIYVLKGASTRGTFTTRITVKPTNVEPSK
ncbi:MAG: T9SS type A sorting domain-containing protein [Cytophagales bacterium]|nr:T9SS type A sorting domain-containing protein [Cytophagales bacterium]